MIKVTDKFDAEFIYDNGVSGNVESYSVEREEKLGFFGYYVNAKTDSSLDPSVALELSCECPDKSFTAIYSHSLYWVQPSFGNRASDIPTKTAAVIFDNADGTYTYVMTAIGKEYKTYIKGENGKIVFYLYSQYPSATIDSELSFISGTGNNLSELIKRGALAMQAFMNNGLKIRSERIFPEVFEYLGWCSWDAFQIRVNHEGLLEKAREFKEKNVPIRYAIIDDMWGDAPNLKTSKPTDSFNEMVKTMHASSLNSFEGDPERFPRGLSAAVSDLKASGIENIGLWFPTTGYWYGLSKDGPAYNMQKNNVEPADGGRIIAIPDAEHAERYFDTFCEAAKGFGCDFVKIDNQSCHFFYKRMHPIGFSSANMQKAIDKAAFKHFDGALINCMGMPTECMLNRPMSAISRCSDDFMPESKSWFAKNILECAYNGILQGRFYYNDWDMWWTDDAQAQKNALCHAISGGPIYISDKLGRTNPEYLKPLTFDDGRILRLSDSAYPTDDCIIGNPTKTDTPFKIRNTFEGGACVAMFNISDKDSSVTGTVCAADAGLDPKRSYLYYEHFSGDFGYVNGDERIYVTLDNNDSVAYYTFVEKTKKDILFLGRIDKYNGVLATLSFDGSEAVLYEGGNFAFVCDEDYIVLDENGNEIECERYGLMVSGCCPRENKKLRFIKYDS